MINVFFIVREYLTIAGILDFTVDNVTAEDKIANLIFKMYQEAR